MTLKHFLKNTMVGRILLIPLRFRFGMTYLWPGFKRLIVWSFRSRELANFTYDLDNIPHLASFVSVVAGIPLEEALGYIDEIESDKALRSHMKGMALHGVDRYISDKEPKYGRRAGWYAFVRAFKPKVVVETGVDKGMGSCVIAAALMRNTLEGFPGVSFGTDLNPKAGSMIRAPYDDFATVLYGDSIESLTAFAQPIDIFINDSDHSADYEGREYDAVHHLLSERSIVLGDNAHVTDKLFEFARKSGRAFLFFREKPKQHWYPGAGIGAAYWPRAGTEKASTKTS